MYTKRNISWKIIFQFAWKNLIFFAVWAGIIVYFFHHMDHHGNNIAIPFLPLSTIGIAVAFYVGFKNNAAYDRFWEARKIWGGIVNYSRTWGNQVMSFVTNQESSKDLSAAELKAIKHELIYRHIAWLYALKNQLRRPSSHSIKPKVLKGRFVKKGTEECNLWDHEVMPFIDAAEYESTLGRKNPATQLIRKQGERLTAIVDGNRNVNDFRHMEMMRVLEEFYNLQGKCERIKNTPFPRQYAYFSKVFTWIFVLLLPFGLVGLFNDMGHAFIWLTVPFSVLISWIFSTMEIVGDNSEDPFENFINDVPMNALCRTIEIDLREMLGEAELPEKVQAIDNVLL